MRFSELKGEMLALVGVVFTILAVSLGWGCSDKVEVIADATPPDAAEPEQLADYKLCDSDDECSDDELCIDNIWVADQGSWKFCTNDCIGGQDFCSDGELCVGGWVAGLFPDYWCYVQCGDPEGGEYGACADGYHCVENSGYGWCWPDSDSGPNS